MGLIDQSYFINDINLPVKTYGNNDKFFAKYEKEILIKLFGYDLYKQIAAYSDLSPQEIKDIVEGKEFTSGDYTYKWNGLKNSDKVSIIAYYVYYYYQRHIQSTTTTTGEVKDSHENAANIEIGYKMQMAWRKMQVLIGESYTTDEEYYNSLYYFMNFHSATYPLWRWSPIGSVNMFDL